MAKLPALISVIAEFDPRGRNAVENLSRELRKAGLVTTGKSGVGAPNMTATDVTNMLLGLVARRSNEAAGAVLSLRDAVIVGNWDKTDPLKPIEHLAITNRACDEDRFTRAGRFIDCIIEELIEHGALQSTNDENEAIFEIDIDVFSPASGLGAVHVTFMPGRENEVSAKFVCTGPCGPLGIQDSIKISELALGFITDAIRKGNTID
jgi:hypothetical protein